MTDQGPDTPDPDIHEIARRLNAQLGTTAFVAMAASRDSRSPQRRIAYASSPAICAASRHSANDTLCDRLVATCGPLFIASRDVARNRC